MGTAGWDMPIQNIKMLAVAPMNMLQAEIYEFAFTLLGAVGYAGIVMLISASVKNNVLALLFSLAVIYVPPMADIFRTNTFYVFGKYIWSPYLLLTVPVLIGIVCMPFAVKKWSRRIRA